MRKLFIIPAIIIGVTAVTFGVGSAHNANVTATCGGGVTINATNYNSNVANGVSWTVGTVTGSATFGASFSKNIPNPDKTIAVAYTVDINQADGNQFDRHYSGVIQPCIVIPTTTVVTTVPTTEPPTPTTLPPSTTSTTPTNTPSTSTPVTPSTPSTTVTDTTVPSDTVGPPVTRPRRVPVPPTLPSNGPEPTLPTVTPVLPETGAEQDVIVGLAIMFTLLGFLAMYVADGRRRTNDERK